LAAISAASRIIFTSECKPKQIAMPKCDLSIELDEPDRIHPGGGTVRGVVRVHADTDVHCKALEVSSGWKTHGRGNVKSEITETVNLFSGQWVAGERTEYRFELSVARWPPSYHGHYLNIDHYVDARAKIPWSFDPKASVPFRMRPTSVGEGTVGSAAGRNQGPAAWLIRTVLFVILATFAVGFAAANSWFGLVILSSISLLLFGLWLFRVFLPKYRLGEVHHHLDESTLSPGQRVEGELVIRPRKDVPINEITVDFQAREQCVSGSGSNRTTHKHVFFEHSEVLQERTTLTAGREHRFALEFRLPEDAPYSIDLDDNDLIWSALLRVNIPRWPDWTEELTVTVIPADNLGREGGWGAADGDVRLAAEKADRSAATSVDDQAGGEITFDETARLLWQSRDDRDQVALLVDAVSGLSMPIEAIVERRLLYGGDDDNYGYDDGHSVWASYPDPPLPMTLYVPRELADEFEQVGREVWRGRGTIVGWDSRHGRLQVKIEQPSGAS
jgi:hypothetical protein